LLEKLQHITESLPLFAPELMLGATALLSLLFGLFSKSRGQVLAAVVFLLGLLLTAVVAVAQPTPTPTEGFLSALSLSEQAPFIRLFFVAVGVAVLIVSWMGKRGEWLSTEYIFLVATALAAMSLMAQTQHLLMVYLTIETISIASYVLTLLGMHKKASAAAIKYLLFGAVASGLMLYGISLLWAMGGTLFLPDLAVALQAQPLAPVLMALFLLLVGLLFKLAAFPFHFWLPDVYQEAPMPVVAFFGIAPKAATILLLINLFRAFEAAADLQNALSLMLATVAVVTITWGNVAALRQQTGRRLLAFSSVAHAGFLLVGLVSYQAQALEALYFYLAVYAFMNFAAFGFLHLFEQAAGSDELEKMQGYAAKEPLLALLVLVLMVSLVGLPITAGFTAKLLVFSALWQSYQLSGETLLLWLLAIGLLNTAISLFYYLKIPYTMYFKEGSPNLGSIPLGGKLFLVAMTLPLLLLFFKPEWLTVWFGNG